jgi:hypothetical protein
MRRAQSLRSLMVNHGSLELEMATICILELFWELGVRFIHLVDHFFSTTDISTETALSFPHHCSCFHAVNLSIQSHSKASSKNTYRTMITHPHTHQVQARQKPLLVLQSISDRIRNCSMIVVT